MMFTYPADRQYETYSRFLRAAGAHRDEWLFVCDYGIGDTYYVCALMMAFRQSEAMRESGASRVAVACKRTQAPVVQMFATFIDRIIGYDAVEREPLHRFSRFEPGQPILVHPFHYGDGRLARFLMKDGITLLDLHRFMLGLSFDATPAPPLVGLEARQRARAKLDAAGLPRGRTVLLAPHAFSMKTLPALFWQRLSDRLQAEGWAVALNYDPQVPMTLPGVPSLEFGLDDAIAVAGDCGWVISSRSGLCDILSTAKCRLSVLYPRLVAERGQRFHHRRAYDLAAMGVRADAEQHVVEIDGDWPAAIAAIMAGRPEDPPE